jgi:hypothetical protein
VPRRAGADPGAGACRKVITELRLAQDVLRGFEPINVCGMINSENRYYVDEEIE